jgi:hypothetical protein
MNFWVIEGHTDGRLIFDRAVPASAMSAARVGRLLRSLVVQAEGHAPEEILAGHLERCILPAVRKLPGLHPAYSCGSDPQFTAKITWKQEEG